LTILLPQSAPNTQITRYNQAESTNLYNVFRFEANKFIWRHQRKFWIQDQAILQMNSSRTTSQILTATCINVTDNWDFYREDGGSRFFRNVVIYIGLCLVKAPNRVVLNILFFVVPVDDYLGTLCQMVRSLATLVASW